MKRALLLLTLMFGILLFSSFALATAETGSCCVIKNDECTSWDMNSWASASDFCTKLPLWGYALETHFYEVPCSQIPADDPFVTDTCKNGFDIPEFSSIAAGIAIAGAIAGFVFLRKKSDRI